MKSGRGVAFQRHLGQLFDGQSVAGLGEFQLLERFVERRDEPAFAALVARHGPMVMGVCRRLLADPLDVEDAFQATFLVLVRRAGSLRDRDRLAPWLFGVARRVATRARADLARRRDRERSGVEQIAAISNLDDPTRELGRALIEEIDRLPGPLREPILLCCIEGLTYDEAASRLGSTAPAIRGRLARARTRLKDRLTRQGFAPTVGTIGALLSAEAVSAAVPSRLLKTTIQVAKAGAVPAGVEVLAEGVIRTMILTKSKILAAAVVACGIAGSSMGVSAQFGGDAQRNRVEADRLDQVEKKLDRVLQALEGRPVQPPTTSAVDDTDPLSPRVFDRQTGRLIGPRVPVSSVPPSPPAPPVQPAPEVKKAVKLFRPTRAIPAPGRDRLSDLEQKVESLEVRLLKLERRLGPDPEADDEGDPGAEPRRLKRQAAPKAREPEADEGDPGAEPRPSSIRPGGQTQGKFQIVPDTGERK